MSIHRYFDATLTRTHQVGISDNQLTLDPGFGFAKSIIENYTILHDLRQAYSGSDPQQGKFPIMVGASRKSMIGKLLDVPASKRLAGTIATNVLGYLNWRPYLPST